MERYLGIDIGAETITLVELGEQGRELQPLRQIEVEHHKEPGPTLQRVLAEWMGEAGWKGLSGAAVTGRLSRLVNLLRVPSKQAQAHGARQIMGDEAVTVVSIGSHGFSVLELRDSGAEVFRENSRCSQGTGNFLRQLVERFGLSIEEASTLAAQADEAAPLSGRCPVILKTDMTHLANKGEDKERILAGLYDAVCENVQVLIKPRHSPPAVLLTGGVTQSKRIRENFRVFLQKNGMELRDLDQHGRALDALGCAGLASEQATVLPALSDILVPPEEAELERVPALTSALGKVHRMKGAAHTQPGPDDALLLGLDIGSTGSKAVAIAQGSREVVWEGYRSTEGNPVGAAQDLVAQFRDSAVGDRPIVAFGATGSGREIVGSMLATCYGGQRVHVINEIAAHAEGALHYDPRVDTIFEIGGQDAKYIRLSGGRVIDAAMNEACSAGTGSFIEEQGKKFSSINDVVHMGKEALKAEEGVSLGQHCSVFMAEIIDEAVAAGVEQAAIVAGIYDSIIQNYLNRVKGSRSVGDVIFCQGMPFSADALAAAVARQTGSTVIVPPNPGTVGALGIALLAEQGLDRSLGQAIDLQRFLDAEVLSKDCMVCGSTVGCGGAGNHCRIDRLRTLVDGKKMKFTWGGGCSLWDKGTGKVKLPDRSPDPFREREDLVAALINELPLRPGAPAMILTDAFALKGLFPFFARYLSELGYNLTVHQQAGHKALKRGIEEANVPFCAPMQQYHGLAAQMAEMAQEVPSKAGIFLPMMRSIERSSDEPHAVLCPIVQSSADILREDLPEEIRPSIVSPILDVGMGGLEGEEFRGSVERLARELGRPNWEQAYGTALDEQRRFEAALKSMGTRALEFCAEHAIIPVLVLGRTYTIYNTVLNSNVPAILREQGVIAIPVDCYPLDDDVPTFKDVFWAYGQRNLRAAWQVQRSEGIYSLWCSNYSCGPDSFNIHFYSHLMEGKPFSIIETDGHSGDAGTKTRVEAFLHCVRQDKAQEHKPRAPRTIEGGRASLASIREEGRTVLIPRMGTGAESLAAAMRGLGLDAEALAEPNRESVRIGRRYTSGKECVPMCVTTGSLLQRVEAAPEDQRFAFLMPTAKGPCRFGVYNILHRIILDRLGHGDRVDIWSPDSANYFAGLPPGFSTLVYTGFAAADMLLAGLYDARPVEREVGAAAAIHSQAYAKLLALLEGTSGGDLSLPAVLMQVANGKLFGCAKLLRDTARELAAVKEEQDKPVVLVVGEIYVRCDPFSNDFVIDQLEKRGLRTRFAPFGEWLEYMDHLNRTQRGATAMGDQISHFVQRRIETRIYKLMGDAMGWPRRTTVDDTLSASKDYLRDELWGEAVLTTGGPVFEWREGLIDGVVSAGPLECMPSKIAEAQLFHAGEREGLPSLTLQLNGDPLAPEVLDNFAFEIKAQWARKKEAHRRSSKARSAGVNPQPMV